MNAKKYLVTAVVLSIMVVAFAASFLQTKRGANEPCRTALTGPSGKFGPVIETVLPAAKTDGSADIMDFETVHALLQPPSEHFNSSADAINDWIHSNGLDISCFVWPNGAACITYDMTVAAVEGKCWGEITEKELLGNPALAPVCHSPRRLLVLGDNRPDTYIFRTGDGTLGMLRIIGLSEDGQGVKICYKLINPAKALSVAM
jgi:hypothetical protein